MFTYFYFQPEGETRPQPEDEPRKELPNSRDMPIKLPPEQLSHGHWLVIQLKYIREHNVQVPGSSVRPTSAQSSS